MKSNPIFTIFGLSALLIVAAGIASHAAQPEAPKQPHLFHFWTDAKGETHVEEIKLGTNKRALIPGVTVNFPPPPSGAKPMWHNTGTRQFAVTVAGGIDVEVSDGGKAHLNVGDMAFLEDLTGKGHITYEQGGQSVYLRVPDSFDVKVWAKGE